MSCYFSNPIRGRYNAWVLQVTDNLSHKVLGEWKQQLFMDLPDSFVELGPGTGANFRYYRRGSFLTAVEPNRRMLSRLQRNAELYGINLDIRGSKVEELDLDDNSAEVIVSTQVLCYTNDLKQALSEVYRTLRPGGRLLFIEHIGAPEGTLLRRIQDLNLVRKPWRWWLEGCNLAYETDSALKTVGFSTTELEYHTTKTLMPVPIRHYIVGTATK